MASYDLLVKAELYCMNIIYVYRYTCIFVEKLLIYDSYGIGRHFYQIRNVWLDKLFLMYEDIPNDCHEMLKCGDKKRKAAIMTNTMHFSCYTVERL